MNQTDGAEVEVERAGEREVRRRRRRSRARGARSRCRDERAARPSCPACAVRGCAPCARRGSRRGSPTTARPTMRTISVDPGARELDLARCGGARRGSRRPRRRRCAMPPIVGVPALATCGCAIGPSSRICWPIAAGLQHPDQERRAEDRHEERGAGGDEQGDHASTATSVEQRSATLLEPDQPARLHEHRVAGADTRAATATRRGGVADLDHLDRARGTGLAARRARLRRRRRPPRPRRRSPARRRAAPTSACCSSAVGRRARASRPSTAIAPARDREPGEGAQRRRHRRRARVVGVVRARRRLPACAPSSIRHACAP